jgi:hypothetical protein
MVKKKHSKFKQLIKDLKMKAIIKLMILINKLMNKFKKRNKIQVCSLF